MSRSDVYRCKGCNKRFNRDSDLSRHLQNARDRRCIAAAAEEEVVYAQLDAFDEMHHVPMAWGGDFFGNDYADEDFPMTAEDVSPRTSHFGGSAQPGAHTPFDSDSESLAGINKPAPPLVEIESDSEDEADSDFEEDDVDEPLDLAYVAKLVDDISGGFPSPPASPASSGSSSPEPAPELENLANELEQEFGRLLSDAEFQALNSQLSAEPVIEKFPAELGAPGAPVSKDHCHSYQSTQAALDTEHSPNLYTPFVSEIDWEVAKWAKLRGVSGSALNDLLGINGLRTRLGLSYKSAKELDDLIDHELSGLPPFQHHPVDFGGQMYDTFLRDIIPCIRALWGDPEFAPYLILAPERHYADQDRTIRLFFDMHTGRWWWRTQAELERERPGATIIPVILSSDKTQLTLFRNKSAYPIYLTIGNIPKEIRRKPSSRAQILVGYLPTDSLKHIKNSDARRLALAHLFHACMRRLMSPLKEAGINGVKMTSGDGITRRCHPLFAVFVGDYPEQCLVTLVRSGDCPVCPTPHEDLEDISTARCRLRDFDEVMDILDSGPPDGDLDVFLAACTEAGIRPVARPFWYGLPYVNIFASITPDILHQLCQGVMKHLLSWLKKVFGAAEIDARCAALPPNHSLRHFARGITSLKRVPGSEHRDICRILLGLVVDLPLPSGLSPARVIRAVRALLDFFYLSQYPVHSSYEGDSDVPAPPNPMSLDLLDDAFDRFNQNHDVFIELGVRHDFNIPKLHTLRHYSPSIKLFGTTDNYNTEYTEHPHIDMAKNAYRASNHRNEYPQMTRWLERKEKIERHALFIKWRLDGCPPLIKPSMPHHFHVNMTRNPTEKAVPFDTLAADHGATSFRSALSRFIIQNQFPELPARQVASRADDLFLGFERVPVYHKAKFWLRDPHGRAHAPDIQDVAHARPRKTNARSGGRTKIIPSRFDTVLVDVGASGAPGVKGYQVAQVRVIFRIPDRALKDHLPPSFAPRHLAYVEWFKAFDNVPGRDHRIYKLTRILKDGKHHASIIPVANISRSVHLFPQFGPHVPESWTSDTSLEFANTFYLNPTMDRLSHFTLY